MEMAWLKREKGKGIKNACLLEKGVLYVNQCALRMGKQGTHTRYMKLKATSPPIQSMVRQIDSGEEYKMWEKRGDAM